MFEIRSAGKILETNIQRLTVQYISKSNELKEKEVTMSQLRSLIDNKDNSEFSFIYLGQLHRLEIRFVLKSQTTRGKDFAVISI